MEHPCDLRQWKPLTRQKHRLRPLVARGSGSDLVSRCNSSVGSVVRSRAGPMSCLNFRLLSSRFYYFVPPQHSCQPTKDATQ
jgi:hypothetical protein